MSNYKLRYFRNISLDIPYASVYRQLGFDVAKTTISVRQKNEIDSYIDSAMDYIDLSAVALRVPIIENNGQAMVLSDDIIFESKHLCSWFKDCGELLFMGATAGKEIMCAINKDSNEDNLTRGVVYNALAGELVDDVLSWTMNLYKRELRRENVALTSNRYSAGFGDFELKNQKLIYDVLSLSDLGIKITSSFILDPEKSVTALCGIFKLGTNF